MSVHNYPSYRHRAPRVASRGRRKPPTRGILPSWAPGVKGCFRELRPPGARGSLPAFAGRGTLPDGPGIGVRARWIARRGGETTANA